MLSTSPWTAKDGKFDYERFFERIVQFFEDPNDLWALETLAWYQKCVVIVSHFHPLTYCSEGCICLR